MPPIRRFARLLAPLTATALVGAGTAVAAAAAPAAATATAAVTQTQTASAPITGGGTVTATLTYQPDRRFGVDLAKDLRLTITRDGAQVLSQALTAPVCGRQCAVFPHAIHAVDLQGHGEPVVFADSYTGGAHCCSVDDFFTYQPATRTYREFRHDWGDPGYTLKTLGGRRVFETNDDRFAYAFTDYAASGLPIQFDRFTGRGLRNVTRSYPARIATDAAQWLRAFRDQRQSHYSDTTGVVAAWAADEDELGRSVQVTRFLRAQAALGHLRSGLPGTPQEFRFIARLDRFLRRTGYLRA